MPKALYVLLKAGIQLDMPGERGGGGLEGGKHSVDKELGQVAAFGNMEKLP